MPSAQLKAKDYAWLVLCLMAVSAAFVWLQDAVSFDSLQHRRLQLQLASSTTSSSQQPSTSSKEYIFKILQLADLHLGEASASDWGPQQDVNSYQVLQSVIPAENPDFIVLSGDQITANDIDANATVYYRQLCEKLATFGRPWAMVFGNHDDAPFFVDDASWWQDLWGITSQEEDEEDLVIKTPQNVTKTSREDLFHVDHSFAPLSLTQLGPRQLFGTSNYILDVHYPDNNQVALQLLFLDTGGGALPKMLATNQVEWFQQQRRNNPTIPMVAFQHIPTQEFVYDENVCTGLADDGIDAIQPDANILNVLENDGYVHFLAVGHQHGNDYCCRTENSNSNSHLHLCFGRHSGYGGYGRWDRGARVYEITIRENDMEAAETNTNNSNDLPSVTWKSWVRMESGEIQDEYDPYQMDENDEDGDNDKGEEDNQ